MIKRIQNLVKNRPILVTCGLIYMALVLSWWVRSLTYSDSVRFFINSSRTDWNPVFHISSRSGFVMFGYDYMIDLEVESREAHGNPVRTGYWNWRFREQGEPISDRFVLDLPFSLLEPYGGMLIPPSMIDFVGTQVAVHILPFGFLLVIIPCGTIIVGKRIFRARKRPVKDDPDKMPETSREESDLGQE